MWLVGDDKVFVSIENGLDHRDRRFIGHFTKVMNLQPFAIGHVRRNGFSVSIQHPVTGDTVQPLFTADGREFRA